MELYYIGITPLGQSPYLWLYTKLYKHILSRGKKKPWSSSMLRYLWTGHVGIELDDSDAENSQVTREAPGGMDLTSLPSGSSSSATSQRARCTAGETSSWRKASTCEVGRGRAWSRQRPSCCVAAWLWVEELMWVVGNSPHDQLW